ncbi:uncharacterized protein LOC131940059 [Physella acuta]|uniref:uncharacterized protein LOC131940059 n=1 Tax=Physella acuta TaxID=109671 RepID=UPI0027DADE1D|nr:uncharacterized protein LOC131940059 [Physella acuta]
MKKHYEQRFYILFLKLLILLNMALGCNQPEIDGDKPHSLDPQYRGHELVETYLKDVKDGNKVNLAEKAGTRISYRGNLMKASHLDWVIYSKANKGEEFVRNKTSILLLNWLKKQNDYRKLIAIKDFDLKVNFDKPIFCTKTDMNNQLLTIYSLVFIFLFLLKSAPSKNEIQLKNEKEDKMTTLFPFTYCFQKQISTFAPNALHTEITVFPVFSMYRIATFRKLAHATNPTYSTLHLASSGFYYPGSGDIVKCEQCESSVQLTDFNTDPSSSIYHKIGCSFIKINQPQAHGLPNDQESIPDTGNYTTVNHMIQQESHTTTLESGGAGNIDQTDSSQISDVFSGYSSDYPDNIFDVDQFECECEDDDGKDCMKNPGHQQFYDLDQLTLQNIPANFRNENLLKLLKLLGELTVKVAIFNRSSTSCKTKKYGTGFVSQVIEDGIHGIQIFILTNRHLVNSQGKSITVEFSFINSNIINSQIIQAESVLHSKVAGNFKSILVCRSSNLNLAIYLNKIKLELSEEMGRLPARLKDLLTRKVFIISHPHGKGKLLSYGDAGYKTYIIKKLTDGGNVRHQLLEAQSFYRVTDGEKRNAIIYTADTCRGSSGAPVITFHNTEGPSAAGLTIWIHNGVDKSSGLGVSTLQEVSTQNDRPKQHGGSLTERDQEPLGHLVPLGVARQPAAVNTSVALGISSYPVYAAFQKRFESFANWLFGHILSVNDLVAAGFFYAGYDDCVRCFQCGVGLKSWKEGDNIIEQHHKHKPSCPLLQLQMRNALTESSRNIGQPVVRENLPSSTLHGLQTGDTEGNTFLPLECYGPAAEPLRMNGSSNELLRINVSSNEPLRMNGSSTEPFSEPETSQKVLEQVVSQSLAAFSLQENLADTHSEGNRCANNNLTSETTQEKSKYLPDGSTEATESAAGMAGCMPSIVSATKSLKDVKVSVLGHENRVLQKRFQCCVCHVKAVKELLLPCGDLCVCTDCSKNLNVCPVCQGQILATVTTYFT